MPGSAIVLFAHGSRSGAWAEPFQALLSQVRAQASGQRVELAFLELMEPSLSACAAALYADGVRELRVVPVFLGMGGHLKEDLPRLVDSVRAGHPDLSVRVDPPIGEQNGVIGAIARAIAP